MTNRSPNPENVRVLQEHFLDGVKRVGTVTAGAREAGVTRSLAKRWIEQDAEFRARFEEAMEEFRDSIEERLMDHIEKGEDGATLRFKAKGELPEKYGPRPRTKSPAQPGGGWEALEQAADLTPHPQSLSQGARDAGDDDPGH